MSTPSDLETVKKNCWNQAFHSFGTAYIFQIRLQKFRLRLRCIAFLGIAVPLIIGGVVTSFGIHFNLLPYFLFFAGFLLLIQLIFSAWSLVSRWDEELSYAIESMTDNNRIYSESERLAKTDSNDIKIRLQMLEVENQSRVNADNKQGITDEERRMGMRASLRQFQKKCSSCGQKPSSMVASTCEVCGQFKRRLL